MCSAGDVIPFERIVALENSDRLLDQLGLNLDAVREEYACVRVRNVYENATCTSMQCAVTCET